MKYLFCFILLISLASCDPYYKLSYCVKNKTKDTVYLKFMNYPDSLCIVKPDSTYFLRTFRGVGYAKEKYKHSGLTKELSANMIMIRKFSDNSMKKVSESTWKWEGGRIWGNAVLYVKK
ncbi:MAG: hypothetical protein ACJ77K_01375 [Bacteroidia bacterium]